MTDHNDPKHVYHERRNPSGCDKFYCLRRYRPLYYFGVLPVKHSVRRLRWFLMEHGSLRGNYALCLIVGHSPIADQCGIPDHDYCAYCMKVMPGQGART